MTETKNEQHTSSFKRKLGNSTLQFLSEELFRYSVVISNIETMSFEKVNINSVLEESKNFERINANGTDG